MQADKPELGKRYTKPKVRRLSPSEALSALTRLAAARGRDLLALATGHERRGIPDAQVTEERWIGVDLDGTLAEYCGWKGAEHVGKPISKMALRVSRWLAQGWRVKIVTARVSGKARAESPLAEVAIKRWAKEHFGRELEVTAEKDFDLLVLYDDRAICVKSNEGTAMRWSGTESFDADVVIDSESYQLVHKKKKDEDPAP